MVLGIPGPIGIGLDEDDVLIFLRQPLREVESHLSGTDDEDVQLGPPGGGNKLDCRGGELSKPAGPGRGTTGALRGSSHGGLEPDHPVRRAPMFTSRWEESC